MIPFAELDIRPEDVAAVCETISSGWLTTGEKCLAFEAALARLIGAAHVLVASSLTSAVAPLLHSLFPQALPRRVVFPTWTFTSVAMEFVHMGVEVELVDVDRNTLLLPIRHYDADVIVPTHLFGNPFDVTALKRLNPTAAIIDDAAHLAPVKRDLSPVAASLYSFYATKPLPTGEGGAVAIHSDDRVAERFRRARLHGITAPSGRGDPIRPLTRLPYDVPDLGWKANMTEICAALGLSQLPRVREGIEFRRALVARYAEALPELGIEMIPHHPDSSFHLAAVRLPAWWPRDRLMADLAGRGIGSSVHYTPLHRLGYWSNRLFGATAEAVAGSGSAATRFPAAELNAERVMSLPLSSMMTPGAIDRVVCALAEARPPWIGGSLEPSSSRRSLRA
jgi:dTDP-4-amino-4,6-dideoxygalactose transaminase